MGSVTEIILRGKGELLSMRDVKEAIWKLDREKGMRRRHIGLQQWKEK